MNEKDDQQLLDSARHALDEQARRLDAVTVAHLQAARARAVEASRAGPAPVRRRPRMLWWSAAAVSTVLVATLGAWLWLTAPGAPLVAGFDDLDILAAKEHPDFYAELEFYSWLASRRPAG